MTASLHIDPPDAMIDVPRRITAAGFAPGHPVEITADLTQNDGTRWRSHASCLADAIAAPAPAQMESD